jgi:adenylylsulfate kinase
MALVEKKLGRGTSDHPTGEPFTLWLTGLSGAGKSTLAYALESILKQNHVACCVLDGDEVRHGLNKDLGFSAADRSENIRRVAEVARLMNRAGLIVIASFISPYRNDRALAQTIIGQDTYFDVYLSASLAACEARDPKQLYVRARAGQIPEFTGVSAPYEAPIAPSLALDTGTLTQAACIAALTEFTNTLIASRHLTAPDN